MQPRWLYGRRYNLKKSVGFIGIVCLPFNINGHNVAALLQVRDASDSWPGACQVTAHGGLEEGEDFKDALFREALEELGTDLAENLKQREHELGEPIFEINVPDEKQVLTYATSIPFSLLNSLDMTKFRLVTPDHPLTVLREKYKKTDLVPPTDTALHADEVEAVQKAFEKFRNPST